MEFPHTSCFGTKAPSSISVFSTSQRGSVADFPISPIIVTLKMEALRYSETSVLTTAIRHNIPEYGILPTVLKAFVLCLRRVENCACVALDGYLWI
jgi:hypothetical protein